MDFYEVDSCCFGLFPLRVGSIFLGLLSALVEIGAHGMESYFFSCGSPPSFRIVFTVLAIVGIAAALLMIVGIVIDKSQLVLIYLITYLLLMLGSIVLLVMIEAYRKSYSYIISTCVYTLIISYSLVIVNSYYYHDMD